MKIAKILAVGTFSLALVSCGGGSGSSSGGSSGGTATLPTLSTSISGLQFEATEGDTAGTYVVSVTYSGTSASSVIPDLQLDTGPLSLSGAIQSKGANGFEFTLASASGLSVGDYGGNLTFRLCADNSCSRVYPGSTQAKTYSLNVKLGDWVTHQRNAAHTGYVDVELDASKFASAWTWQSGQVYSAKAAAAHGGAVYFAAQHLDGTSTVYALNSASGSELWHRGLGAQHSVGGAAYADGRVYVMSMVVSSETNPIWYLDSATGAVLKSPYFDSQWSEFFAPVPFGGKLYVSAGYFNDAAYAYDAVSGAKEFATAYTGYVYDKNVPAVDANYVYHYDGVAMNVYRRGDGSLYKSFADPLEEWAGYSYDAAPILAGNGLILAFGGVGSADWARGIVAYDLSATNSSWQTGKVYGGIPALSGETLFVANHSRGSVQGLSVGDGSAVWEWTPSDGNTKGGNIIATRNLLFFSSTSKTYAIDLTGSVPTTVWEVSSGGQMTLTPDYKLVVTNQNTGKVTAFSLN